MRVVWRGRPETALEHAEAVVEAMLDAAGAIDLRLDAKAAKATTDQQVGAAVASPPRRRAAAARIAYPCSRAEQQGGGQPARGR